MQDGVTAGQETGEAESPRGMHVITNAWNEVTVSTISRGLAGITGTCLKLKGRGEDSNV